MGMLTFFSLVVRCFNGLSSRQNNGFPSTFSVLSTAVLVHFHYLLRACPRSPGLHLCPWSASSVLIAQLLPPLPRCSRPSPWDVVKPPTDIYQST
ncbi:hypothetical protein DPMN_156333 [Dreissena polymorpha]|uniref:Uncharacterized protein n=1 Tax=Dreissena polymorpha TaxID=45954 RepID=A0A9D4J8Q2_DREPO|nr:hypothetical protein DPMN_156333 [Dreissena polymorpha]